MNFLTGKRLIIFDCDGVLIDANQANINFFNECLKRGGYPPLPEDLHEKVVYQSTKQLMFELFPDPAEAGRMHQISQETDYTPFLDDVRPLFDYGRVLGALRKRFSLAVATNRGRSLDRLFKHFSLDTWFEYRVSVLDTKGTTAMVNELEAAWGGLDVLVNNAGITHNLPLALLE
ncbi:MAG TPA: HAD hydrolase-like protein, partial [Spirochaetota bacterium]|nr:HAD hydrolase-like protein [Spirochaetota bacterium]